MKVLFIATYSGLSGASHSLVSLIKHLRQKGVEAFVVLPKKGKIEKLFIEENIPYKIVRLYNWVTPIEEYNSAKQQIKWKIKKLVNSIQEYRILNIIKKYNIDLIHINAVTASWGYKSAKKTGIPVVWHIREFLEEDLNKRFWEKNKSLNYLSNANAVIAISESVKNKYQDIIRGDNIIRIYNGIDWKYSEERTEIFNKKNIIISLAGRIVPSKGHEDVVRAVHCLVQKGIKNFKVQFIGVEADKNFVRYLKKIINENNIAEFIEFKGYQRNMFKLWSETDIALICSKAEAFGRVTIEAMMAGSLVIGANSKGTAELIGDKYGLTYEQGNPLSLAEKIEYAIRNKHEMNVLSERAKQYAHKNFTAKINAEKVYSVYEKVLKLIE